jgi:hypothetical protein
MRKLFSAFLLTLVTTNAFALSTQIKELLATVAMPLAVAAISNVNGVQPTQLSNLVSTLNQANVPPTQFVDVMRYTPVALTDSNGQPFVAYVQTQASQGLTGDALVTAMLQQLRTQYNVTPQPVTYFVEDNYIAPSYVTPFDTGQFDNNTIYPTDSLDVIALPLAVAQVADIGGVPLDQLATLITSLNQANMPPAQMIEVVRYVPVALIDNGQTFVQYVQQQTAQGITGPALYPVVVRQLQPYYPSTQISVIPPAVAPPPQPVVVTRTAVRQERVRRRPVVVDQNFFPPVVVTRAAEVRQHPHGGPPGQLKKQLGVQTGAQVVHAQPPVVVAPRVEEKGHGKGRGPEGKHQVVVAQPPPAAVPPVAVPQAVAAPQGHGNGKGPEGAGPPGQNKDKEHGKGKGKD